MNKCLKENIEIVGKSDLFDSDWYTEKYPDVKSSGVEPVKHYVKYGGLLGRDPSEKFCTKLYKSRYPEELLSSDNALIYYLNHGKKKKHDIKIRLYDAKYFLNEGQDVEARNLVNRCNRRSDKCSLELLLLNQEMEKDSDWLRNINSFFEKFEMAPVGLSNKIRDSRFLRLESLCKSGSVEGEKISVIMPAFNAEKTIQHSIQSILNQTWKNIQLIIIDDCSSDRTYELAKQAIHRDPRALLLKGKINVGPYVSKNLALKYCDGNFITGHDADDWAHPQRLEWHVNKIKSQAKFPKASLSYMFRMTEDGISEIRKGGAFVGASISTMFDRGFLKDELGHWDCVRFGADSELIARAKKILGSNFKEYSFPSMICLASETSLTSHPDFGVSHDTGLSPIRLEYRHSWEEWHSSMNRKNSYLKFPSNERHFSAPDKMKVPVENQLLSIEKFRKLTAF